jgi:hypothetical protein
MSAMPSYDLFYTLNFILGVEQTKKVLIVVGYLLLSLLNINNLASWIRKNLLVGGILGEAIRRASDLRLIFYRKQSNVDLVLLEVDHNASEEILVRVRFGHCSLEIAFVCELPYPISGV